MKKNIIYIVAAAIIIGLAAYKITDNKKQQETEVKEVAKQVEKINVNVLSVKREYINTDYIANGTFIPKQEMNQSSEISGRIVNVLVKEGSKVNAGQTLATIKRDAIEVDVNQAQNNLQNAIIDNQRYENAYKTGGVTKQQLDNSRLQLKNAQTSLKAQGVKVNDTSIRAGISGTINKKMVEPGTVVSPGAQMFEIVNINTLKLSVLVDESQIGRIRLGQSVSITVSVLPEMSFTGTITFIAPKSDASLNFPVEIEVPNNGELKAGMYATAIFKTNNGAESQSMLTVPSEAFVNGVSSGQIYIVNNGKAKLIKVQTGKVYGNKVQIISGLIEGTQIITSGQINLDNGAKINIVKQ
jgi:membrane fusion protein, multidrug efflux system